MARMIDLVRASAVPATLMQSAAKGALSVPPREMIEILVYLAVHSKIFGEQAQLTLAGWDEAASRAAAGDPTTPREVLEYLVSPKNLRPLLLPALLTNPSVSEESWLELAPSAGRDLVEVMLKSERITQSPGILSALLSNPNLSGIQSENIRKKIEQTTPAPAEPEVKDPEVHSAPEEAEAGSEEVFPASSSDEVPEGEDVLDEGVLAYLAEHESEIAAQGDHALPADRGYSRRNPGR